ncbi:MAG: ABC transporter ATP-binding protein [Elusimicrobiota bacterium]|jgi:putative ABC transport system ATP-binding protein|nr:ABC transporter ATP-binding protein [Elusimicrobiota bacterium]
MNNDIIEISHLTKTFSRGCEKIYALNDISFTIKSGSFTSIIGQSGSGKTTLVNILGCLDNLTSGSLKVDNQEIFKEGLRLSESKLALVRRKFFGYVFQRFFLIPTLTVRENILIPSVFQKEFNPDENRIENIMSMLGILKRQHHLPRQLSGGEMQRTSIARALINNPKVLIADEPTGNLDSKRSDEIRDLLIDLNKNNGITIILVTHNPELAEKADKIIKLLDGKITN